MSEIDARIRGRVNLIAGVNSHYPKFIVLSEEPLTYATITSEEDLALWPDDQVVFEPTLSGFGTSRRVLYVPTNQRTYLFLYPLALGATWGSNTVTFADYLTFQN